MVELATITASNSRFASEQHKGRVCVFAGATMGIGFGTLRQMVTMLHTSTFYVLGRNEANFAVKLEDLRASAPTCKIVFVECQLSLITSIDAACEHILEAEKKLDVLCMSPGGMPFQGAVLLFSNSSGSEGWLINMDIDTEEGLELCFVLSYYARLRILSNLWPLLLQAPQARVLSVLNGTKEKRIDEDDLGLKRKWSITGVVNQTTICTSLAFDYWAADDNKHKITFIHAAPGFVNTGTLRTSYPSMKDGVLWWAFISLMQIVSGWIINYTGFSLRESGQRHAYHLTSDRYRPGSWRTNYLNEITPDNDSLKYYREHGWTERIWDHTVWVWDQALIKGASF